MGLRAAQLLNFNFYIMCLISHIVVWSLALMIKLSLCDRSLARSWNLWLMKLIPIKQVLRCHPPNSDECNYCKVAKLLKNINVVLEQLPFS